MAREVVSAGTRVEEGYFSLREVQNAAPNTWDYELRDYRKGAKIPRYHGTLTLNNPTASENLSQFSSVEQLLNIFGILHVVRILAMLHVEVSQDVEEELI